MTDTFSQGPDGEARARVRNRYGSAVARKATPRFVAMHGEAGAPAAPETARPGRAGTVLEFRQPPHAAESAAAGLQQSDRWHDAVRAVARAIDAGESHAALLRARAILRQGLIDDYKTRFSRECGAVLDELGRATGGPLGPLSRRVTESALQPRLVQTCWLNYTARAAAAPAAVASVADAPEVALIDVPRRLDRELSVSAVTIGAPAFRAGHGLTGRGVVVAVVDSEVPQRHPMLAGRVIHKSNFTREPWGFADAHGTAVAGIVAASGGLDGIAPEATIWNYKVLATNPNMNADDFGGARALQQALEDGAHVANCSWGAGPATDGTGREARACDTAWSLGLVIVKSAGNRGPGTATLTTPADAHGVIVVGACDRQGAGLAAYSSRGPTTDGRQRPHVVAPGGDDTHGIVSLAVSGGTDDAGYGTSYAAPHVTGVLALLLQQDPARDPEALRQLVVGMGRPLAGVDPAAQGTGLVVLP